MSPASCEQPRVAELSLAIAGVSAEIATRDPHVADVVRERYKGFLSGDGAAERPRWRIELDAPTSASPISDDVVVRPDGRPDRFVVSRGDLSGTVDLAERRGTASLATPNEFAVDTFLRIVYSLALVDAGGLIVHAASLMRRGRAFLFCGRSGAGKTTLARLSRDATLLSDELSIVRITDRGIHCHGTPFWGELARAGEDCAAPLRAIYFLRQGPRHAVEPVSPRAAVERLLPNVLFFAREPLLTARVFDLAATLVATVPCADLTFRLDAGFWEVIDHA
jgi:hypothetical protein